MEELNKTQIVLLVLLVSFVTSIATGIVTVTLLEQAPQGVTQTINRIVETTVEKIVPKETIIEKVREVQVQVGASVEDQIVSAVRKATPALVSIKIPIPALAEGELPSTELRSGFMVKSDGIMVTTATRLEKGGKYTVTIGETSRKGIVRLVDENNNIATISIIPESSQADEATTTPAGEVINSESFTALKLSRDKAKLGQTVVSLSLGIGGDPEIALGLISRIREASASTTPRIYVSLQGEGERGSPLVDLRGEAVGLITAIEGSGKIISIPVSLITRELEKLSASDDETTTAGAGNALPPVDNP